MNEPFDNPGRVPAAMQESPEAEAKRKMWRNLFLLSLGASVMLVGIFWLPVKFFQMEQFFSSPSVNLPQAGQVSQSKPPPPEVPTNMLGTRYGVINASSEKDWTYFDFSRGKEVRIHDQSSLEWDLAFRRGKVISNGGATNKFGKAGLLDLGEVEFDTVSEAPLNDYVLDSSTRTETENPVLLKWYKYNYLSHKLSARRNVYAVRTADNKFAKMQFISFYCDNKEAGCIKIRYVYQDKGTNSFLNEGIGLAASVASSQGEPNKF